MHKIPKIIYVLAGIFLLVASGLNILFVNMADATIYSLSLGLFIVSLGFCLMIVTNATQRQLLAAIAATIGIYIGGQFDALIAQITAAGALIILVTMMFYSISIQLARKK